MYIPGDASLRIALGLIGFGVILIPAGILLLEATPGVMTLSSTLIIVGGSVVAVRGGREGRRLGIPCVTAGLLGLVAPLMTDLSDELRIIVGVAHMLVLAVMSAMGVYTIRGVPPLAKTLMSLAFLVYVLASMTLLAILAGVPALALLFPSSLLMASLFLGTAFLMSAVLAGGAP